MDEKQREKEEKEEEVKECSLGRTDSQSCSDEGRLYKCGICLSDNIDPAEVVQKPCSCVDHFCKKCYNETMCNDPRCPLCRASIGFDYDLDKGEVKFLLYDKEESALNGMIMLPENNGPWAKLSRAARVVIVNEMAKRSRPAFLKMLHSQPTGEHGARTCMCGGKNCFRRMPVEELRNCATWTAICDGCGAHLWLKDEKGKCVTDEEGKTVLTETHMWSCERNEKSMVHRCSIIVCDDCMSGNKAVPEDAPFLFK